MADQIVITGEIQPSQRRSRRRRCALWGRPSGRGSFARPARAGRCCAGMETLVAILLRPEGSIRTRPAQGGNKAAKLRVIREALRSAKRVWLATDCDRKGQLIGQEILEHYNYSGQVMRVLFIAQDHRTIRDAFDSISSDNDSDLSLLLEGNISFLVLTGKTKHSVCPALRRCCGAPPSRPNVLIAVAYNEFATIYRLIKERCQIVEFYFTQTRTELLAINLSHLLFPERLPAFRELTFQRSRDNPPCVFQFLPSLACARSRVRRYGRVPY